MGLLKTLAAPIGGLMNIGSTLLQNQQQKKAQNREFAQNEKMWNLSNQYNSPQMQMQRLKEAGLNPNLVYGNSSVVGNTSTSTPKYQAPQINRLPTEGLNPLEMLGAFQDLRQKTAQADLTSEHAIGATKENKYKDLNLAAALSSIEQSTRGKINANLMQEWLLGSPMSSTVQNSPYMKKYSAQVRSSEQQNQLRQFELNFHKQFGSKAAYGGILQILKMLK